MREELKYYEDESFYPFLKRLDQIKNSLKKYSLMSLYALLSSIVSMALYAFIQKYSVQSRYNIDFYKQLELILFIITFALIFFGIILLFKFNTLRDKGMILYEEITDEIDWSRKRKEFIHRPPMELRIIIKEFLKSTDLPFTSGKNGQGFYILLFILMDILI